MSGIFLEMPVRASPTNLYGNLKFPKAVLIKYKIRVPRGCAAPCDVTSSDEAPMLYLTRKAGESVIINDDIEVTVVDIRGRSVKLGFTFPQGASVLRRELYEKIQRENLEAAQASADFLTAGSKEPQKAGD